VERKNFERDGMLLLLDLFEVGQLVSLEKDTKLFDSLFLISDPECKTSNLSDH
jgi:hypothetical protein